ncbi:hypothetical protein DSL72_006500 [Monilinia vaccinii-corymbosi]|uniref:Uncharacterized protein n=1 Tax=Monilinia vaccinii-corymbosi TaxID=61207 RepID=A0A8A3PNA3_9HELO|nr:hypothetical protein DSL72_006500 [Monilinia vaccinii-corymbosi]
MITKYHTFLVTFLLFVWVLYYTGSLPIGGGLGAYGGKGEEKTGNVLGGVGNGGAGSEGFTISGLGRLEEVEEEMSGPGDASPHEEKEEEEERRKKEADNRKKEKEEEERKKGKEDGGRKEKEAKEKEEDANKDAKEVETSEEEGNEKSAENNEDKEGAKNEDASYEADDNTGKEDKDDKTNSKVGISTPSQKPPSLRSFCETVTFRPGLYLQCHSWSGPNATSISGGLNNARNRIQTCLRLALDLGSSIIIPTVQTQRNAKNPITYAGKAVCADVYWDIDFLIQEIGSACPGLEMRRCGDISGIDGERIVQMEKREYHQASYHAGAFKSAVDEHLQSLSLSSFSSENPVVVGFGDTIYAYNYTYDSEQALQKQLFRTLKYNSKLLDLGSQLRDTPELRDGYVGVHFRGENDWPRGFGSREEQMDAFMREIDVASAAHGAAEGIKTIYISCGDEAAIEIFREPLSALGYQVYDKWALVSSLPGLSSQLKEMEFDTMAIVDYAVLVGANFFLGVWMSTFSQTIAYARTAEDEDDFWETYITPGSRRAGSARVWDHVPALKGDDTTKILVVNTGDISNMDSYP